MAPAPPSSTALHPSRRAKVPAHPNSKAKSKSKHPRLRALNPAGDTNGSGPSTGALRNSIRNLERMLAHAARMPATLRMDKERELAHYRLDLEEKRRERKKKEMIGKYHMVRFFERRKASRRLRKLKTLLCSAPEGSAEAAELQAKVNEAVVDLKYTLYSPLTEKYTSLYAENDEGKRRNTGPNNIDSVDEDNKEDEDRGADALIERRKEKPEWWLVVERAIKEGKLDEVREGTWPARPSSEVSSKDNGGAGTSKDKPNPAPKKTVDRGEEEGDIQREKRQSENVSQVETGTDKAKEEDSDGGFFEE